jgi:hypothetical protein
MESRLLIKCVITLVTASLLASSSCSSGRGEAEAGKPLLQSTTKSEATEVPLLTDWRGTYPVSELKRLPEAQRDSGVGFIADPKLFASVWAAFKPDEALPTVDFRQHVVIFARNTQFFNRTSIGKATVTDGVLTVLTMETRSANPIEDQAAMAMAVVPRAGVRFIQTGAKLMPLDGLN